MRRLTLILIVLFTGSANAELASTNYVNSAVESRVDTSSNAKQVMAGEYTVTGTLHVETPPLPPAD